MELFCAGLPPEQRTPVRAAGLARAKGGAAQVLTGMVTVAARATKPANGRLVSAALSDTAGIWAGFIAPDARRQILNLTAQARRLSKDEDVRSNLASFSAALAAVK